MCTLLSNWLGQRPTSAPPQHCANTYQCSVSQRCTDIYWYSTILHNAQIYPTAHKVQPTLDPALNCIAQIHPGLHCIAKIHPGAHRAQHLFCITATLHCLHQIFCMAELCNAELLSTSAFLKNASSNFVITCVHLYNAEKLLTTSGMSTSAAA